MYIQSVGHILKHDTHVMYGTARHDTTRMILDYDMMHMHGPATSVFIHARGNGTVVEDTDAACMRCVWLLVR